MSTKDVADFVVNATYDTLPQPVIAYAKKAIRDNIGVSLAAHAVKDTALEAARKLALEMGGKEESTLIGLGVKVPCNMAAFVNSIMGSTLDMDDGARTARGSLGHPGGMIVPASLGVAECQNATGRELIEAVVVGYETSLCTGLMMMGSSGMSGKRGSYGVAAAAARLLKLNTEETSNALGIAEAHRPEPSYATIWEKTAMTKEAMGWGAMTGVTAALLARAGFGGPRTVYDLPEYDNKPLKTLGKEWRISGLYFKPYSVCRCAHTSIEGLLELIKEHHLRADDISKITVGVSTIAAKMVTYPPATSWEAQYSIVFAIGAALTFGEVGPEEVTNQLGNRRVRSQAKKVQVVIDPEVDALWPEHAAKVEIETKEGKSYRTFKLYPKGDTRNPLSDEELREKFAKLATMVLGVDKALELGDLLDRLETLSSVNDLIDKLRFL